jgi:HTH-type transcriptional regulator / antitoxin HigA
MIERIPVEVFPPGEFLNDELDERNWTQSEFAEIIRRPVRVVNEIIMGKKAITIETARELAAALGTSPQFWLNLQTSYDLWRTAPTPQSDVIARDAKLRERFPVREMIKRNWIRNSENYNDLESAVFKFFGISSLNDTVIFDHAPRRNHEQSLWPSQQAWLFRVGQLASALNTPKYSEVRLRESISRLELLMTEPEEIRHVPTILSECGVRFVIVEPIPGSRIDGVCFWIDKNRSPIIGLSLKGSDQIDRFWFNLRHEIEHVLRGDGRDGAIIDTFEEIPPGESDAEQAANLAAADFCVPALKMQDFYLRHHPIYTEKSLIGFSRIVKRHPGLVAGQLQRRLNRWDLFKKYQVKVRHILTQTALTDGYGKTISIGD